MQQAPTNGTISSAESAYDEDEDLAQWNNDLHISSVGSNEVDFSEESHVPVSRQDSGLGISRASDPMMTTMSEDFMLPSTIDFSLDNFLQPFPGSPAQPPPVSRQRLPSVYPMPTSNGHSRSKSQNDSQFVIDCTQIISDLENYIVADLKSFKIVLGLVKRALEKLVQLSDMQQGTRTMRCMILLTAIVYQIVELLEVCFVMLSEESDRQSGPNLTSLRPSGGLLLPGLGLGDFGIDVEEQNAWRSQMLLKEVRQASEVLRRLKTLAYLGPEVSAASAAQGSRGREQCFVDLELRLTDLAGRIARRR